jgi:3-hydroxybutyryl-CoA dehydrogenase
MSREFTKVGVVGLGTMGAGIAEVFARNGIEVVAVEVAAGALERGQGFVSKSTGRAVSRGKLAQEDADALHARITFTTDMADCADCELDRRGGARGHRAEAKSILTQLDDIVAEDAILATNTSAHCRSPTIAMSTQAPQAGARHALLRPRAQVHASLSRSSRRSSPTR